MKRCPPLHNLGVYLPPDVEQNLHIYDSQDQDLSWLSGESPSFFQLFSPRSAAERPQVASELCGGALGGESPQGLGLSVKRLVFGGYGLRRSVLS